MWEKSELQKKSGLQKILDNEGTMLLPDINQDFCKGVGFDYYRTSVKIGALPKATLKMADL